MDRIREWSFPVVLLTLWFVVAGYTLSSLGEAHAAVSAARKPTLVVPATVDITVVASKRPSLARKGRKPVDHRTPGA